MNDEIKEILDLLRDTADLSFFAVCGTKEELKNMPKCVSKRLAITNEQAKALLDYIINLQQRMEGLEAENETLRSDFKNQVEYTNKLYRKIIKAIVLLELKQLRYLNENDYRICSLDLQEVKDILQKER